MEAPKNTDIKEKIKKQYISLTKTIEDIKKSPSESLPRAFNILVIFCGVICSIVSYVKFLIQEGYPKNIDIHKFNELFTKGTVSI